MTTDTKTKTQADLLGEAIDYVFSTMTHKEIVEFFKGFKTELTDEQKKEVLWD